MLSNELQQINIDGQQLFFPNLRQWEEIAETRNIDNSEVGDLLINEFFRIKHVLEKFTYVKLAYGKVGNWNHYPYVILSINNNYQRVHLETLKCNSCSWVGMSANPLISDLYLGVEKKNNEFELMSRAKNYPLKSCPNCKSKLPRYPIWVEGEDFVTENRNESDEELLNVQFKVQATNTSFDKILFIKLQMEILKIELKLAKDNVDKLLNSEAVLFNCEVSVKNTFILELAKIGILVVPQNV